MLQKIKDFFKKIGAVIGYFGILAAIVGGIVGGIAGTFYWLNSDRKSRYFDYV